MHDHRSGEAEQPTKGAPASWNFTAVDVVFTNEGEKLTYSKAGRGSM